MLQRYASCLAASELQPDCKKLHVYNLTKQLNLTQFLNK